MSYEDRNKMYFVAPDIEDCIFREGDFLDPDSRRKLSEDIKIAKEIADAREKTKDHQEKVDKIMNKASKLL